MPLAKTVCRGVDNLPVNGLADLWNLTDKKSQNRPMEADQCGREKAVGWT